MKLSYFESARFVKDLDFKWVNEFEHGNCQVLKYTECLDDVSRIILKNEVQSYQVCRNHKVFRKIPFERSSTDKLILDVEWENLEEESK